MKRYPTIDILLGVAVGDAIGVPVEFRSRGLLARDPVTGVRGYGSHHQPPGTWSDDSSLTFCLAEMLCSGYDLDDLARRFINWKQHAYWTAHGNVFDIGNGTAMAIDDLADGVAPLLAGGDGEDNNGNGSLMRILPLVFYLNDKDIAARFAITSEVSSLTHRHERSAIACFLYLEMALALLQGKDLPGAYQRICGETGDWLSGAGEAIRRETHRYFSRILSGKIATYHEREIFSSGYVIHTLEATLWCLLTTGSYRDAVLRAVNLGEDTDTTGAVTGGLAALAYGSETIPAAWLESLARKEDIKELGRRLAIKTEKQWQGPTS
jgi:ADP-ribosyl-[dinitrogen reductase] hydrolase